MSPSVVRWLRASAVIAGSIGVLTLAAFLFDGPVSRMEELQLAGRLEVAAGGLEVNPVPVTEGVWLISGTDDRAGHVVRVETGGYRGRIVVLVGVLESGDVIGVTIVEHFEPADFIERALDARTGATITADALAAAVDRAVVVARVRAWETT